MRLARTTTLSPMPSTAMGLVTEAATSFWKPSAYRLQFPQHAVAAMRQPLTGSAHPQKLFRCVSKEASATTPTEGRLNTFWTARQASFQSAVDKSVAECKAEARVMYLFNEAVSARRYRIVGCHGSSSRNDRIRPRRMRKRLQRLRCRHLCFMDGPAAGALHGLRHAGRSHALTCHL